MSFNKLPCPIWDELPHVWKIPAEGQIRGKNRTGGEFLLMRSGADLLQKLTCRQKANLSYWIYCHNLQCRIINTHEKFEEKPSWANELLELDEAWVVDHRDVTPSTSEHMLMFLRELIRSDDAGEQRPDKDLLQAAGGCRHDDDLTSLLLYAMDRGWLEGGGSPEDPFFPRLNLINLGLGARMYVDEVDEQLRERGGDQRGENQQVFVAMWFDNSMVKALECGIEPAIRAAGYDPLRIDRKRYLGPVADEILAEIRKSKFVVADLTGRPECGAPGGVYYEAGFAHALDIPVIYTCHKDRKDTVHFDVNHLYRIEWENPKDLKTKLQQLIEEVLDHGPLSSPNGDQEVAA